MMRAAIYARRSTEEHQDASLAVQLEGARQYVARKGWTIADEHVFVDDAVSRAEFKKRPGLFALLAAAERGEFDAVVTRDETRLGGDMVRTSLLIQDIRDAGVALWYYFTDEEVRVDNPMAKFAISARNFASELEREKVSQRTHEHLLSKARRGLNVGGRCFGYDNVEVREGGRRKEVRYAINEEQAGVVRDIYARRARGEGFRTIAKALNEQRIPSPRAGARGTGSWSPSVVRTILFNERYRGVIQWNQRQKTYKRGTKVRVARPDGDWLRVEAPHLRIVDEQVWLAVQARHQQAKRDVTSPKGGRPSTNMLSGVGRCACCGGAITVANGKAGKHPIKVYGCAYHRNRGPAVCGNTLRRPVDSVNEALIGWVEANILTEDLVVQIVREVRRRLNERSKQTDARTPSLQADARKLEAEIARLVEAIATGGQRPEPLVQAVAERQDRLSQLHAQIRAAEAAPQAIDLELRRLEGQVRKRIRELKAMLDRNPAEARQIIKAVFEGPLRFTPIAAEKGPRYRIEGTANRLKMLADDGFTNLASPAGFEPALQP